MTESEWWGEWGKVCRTHSMWMAAPTMATDKTFVLLITLKKSSGYEKTWTYSWQPPVYTYFLIKDYNMLITDMLLSSTGDISG
jgi:hypothetical protein